MGRVYLLIRNDDICALSDHGKEDYILSLFKKYRIPQVIGVIPRVAEDPHDHRGTKFHPLAENTPLCGLLKVCAENGIIEIAQHGFTHQTNCYHPSRLDQKGAEKKSCRGIDRDWLPYKPENPEGYSEFNGLKREEQASAIKEGKAHLEEIFDRDIKTFIFPWDRLNITALELLSEAGFEFVLCSNTSESNESMTLIDYVLRDEEIFVLPEYLSRTTTRHDFFMQITYHSWMITGKELSRLEQLLAYIASDDRITCLTPRSIDRLIPQFKTVVKSRRIFEEMAEDLNSYFLNKLGTPRFYILAPHYYKRKTVSAKWYRFLMERKRCGLKIENRSELSNAP